MKILLIEDDGENADYVANGLREEGHLVAQAASGPEGLICATGDSFDLLIVDRMIPGLDGLNLVELARGRPPYRRFSFSLRWAVSRTGSPGSTRAVTIIWSNLLPFPSSPRGSPRSGEGRVRLQRKPDCKYSICSSICYRARCDGAGN